MNRFRRLGVRYQIIIPVIIIFAFIIIARIVTGQANLNSLGNVIIDETFTNTPEKSRLR